MKNSTPSDADVRKMAPKMQETRMGRMIEGTSIFASVNVAESDPYEFYIWQSQFCTIV